MAISDPRQTDNQAWHSKGLVRDYLPEAQGKNQNSFSGKVKFFYYSELLLTKPLRKDNFRTLGDLPIRDNSVYLYDYEFKFANKTVKEKCFLSFSRYKGFLCQCNMVLLANLTPIIPLRDVKGRRHSDKEPEGLLCKELKNGTNKQNLGMAGSNFHN